ncbi:Isoleucyl-tRNA synthetase [Giardia muris]|uniref:isoleucine--tRNA ligase n=1 Tax=Giardia muris TaxID=5742 RepID=A0A4Z1T4K1_GIAMU|nr:Isoleucyl-tRNA synthetase [Giardia muris]|eukprot:TNJ27459.1 Isoleucyl-tRNA synthetase [Giardia muris]
MAFVPPTAVSPPQGLLDFPSMEEAILRYWDEIRAFETQLQLTRGLPRYNFFDGPPFATGLPHYGHMLAGTIKDVVCRYQAMNGRYVERRFGWDCHGLPVEYEIDQLLGVKSPADVVERIGIARYNRECRGIVMRYSREWQTVVRRSGRWVDFANDYKTMNLLFMESVWWVFKQLFDQGLVYEGTKVMPYSTACATPLSNFEANLNYKDVQDPTCIVSFPVIIPLDNHENGGSLDVNVTPERIRMWQERVAVHGDVRLVAWTTTPWTLPSNLGLCVNPDLTYLLCTAEAGKDPAYFVAEPLVSTLFPPENVEGGKASKQKRPTHIVLDSFKGSELAGLRYEPLFSYFSDGYAKTHACWKVVADDYVTADSGVGIVHLAPFFGEDDYRVGINNSIVKKDGEHVCPIDESGHYYPVVTDFSGMYVKDADKHILRNLKERGRLVSQSTCTHSYPFCWRSETPLIYRAVPSWFVRVEAIKKEIIACNAQATWVPKVIQDKRFHNWLENARDWSISRNRFWGCPIPVWVSADRTQVVVIGSIQELSERAGLSLTKISDIHRDNLDHITIPDPRGEEYPPLRRIEPVFDCWFESGSMPYAQKHYPFNAKYKIWGLERFQQEFPADFVAEGLDQTRGWFYTLLIISTALFKRPPAMNCIVNGLVLASDGQKMSKRKRNYPPVEEVISRYGADAMRLYLINSPAVHAQDLRFREEGVRDIVKDLFVPWYNSFCFLAQQVIRYEGVTGRPFKTFQLHHELPLFEAELQRRVGNVLDMWILAELEHLTGVVRREMEGYRLYTVLPDLVNFINDLTKWYIKLNRDALKGDEGDEAALLSLNVLSYVLLCLCRLMAPYTPFLCDWLYLQLRPLLTLDGIMEEQRFSSIHFWTVPKYDTPIFRFSQEPRIREKVDAMKKVLTLARMVRRDKCNVASFKMPLSHLIIAHDDPSLLHEVESLATYIQADLNVVDLEFRVGAEGLAKLNVIPDFMAIREVYRGDKEKLRDVINASKEFCANFANRMECVQELRQIGSCTYEGIVITSDFCKVVLEPIEHPGQASATDANGFLCVFDTVITHDLQVRATERALFSLTQKLRRAAKLVLTDEADVYVHTVREGKELLTDMVASLKARVNGTIAVGVPPRTPDAMLSLDMDLLKCEASILQRASLNM